MFVFLLSESLFCFIFQGASFFESRKPVHKFKLTAVTVVGVLGDECVPHLLPCVEGKANCGVGKESVGSLM